MKINSFVPLPVQICAQLELSSFNHAVTIFYAAYCMDELSRRSVLVKILINCRNTRLPAMASQRRDAIAGSCVSTKVYDQAISKCIRRCTMHRPPPPRLRHFPTYTRLCILQSPRRWGLNPVPMVGAVE